MTLTGGCYCGALRYEATGSPTLKAQCHCRECQYISGGGPNYFMLWPSDGFRLIEGEAAEFTRSDLPNPVTRVFCPTCGTHLATRLPGRAELVLKVGTLDDRSFFDGARLAIYTIDKPEFHHIADGLPAFERLPTG